MFFKHTSLETNPFHHFLQSEGASRRNAVYTYILYIDKDISVSVYPVYLSMRRHLASADVYVVCQYTFKDNTAPTRSSINSLRNNNTRLCNAHVYSRYNNGIKIGRLSPF
jgi:hypothetical protein